MLELTNLLWPENQPGLRCVAVLRQGKHNTYWTNTFFTTNDAARAEIARCDAAPNVVAVYHGCSLFDRVRVEQVRRDDMAARGRNWSPKGRTADNVCSVNALWCDIDVKPGEPAAYPDKASATAAVRQLARDFRKPSAVVQSGTGFHLYWALDSALEPDAWLLLAERLKTWLAQAGYKVDPKRTSDLASVLRPPDTTNRKTSPGTKVAAGYTGAVYSADDLHSCLDNLGVAAGGVAGMTSTISAAPSALPAHIAAATGDDNLKEAYADSKLKGILSNCAQIRQSVQTKGAGDSEPIWLAMLRTVSRCSDVKDSHLHAVSQGHAGYNARETDLKIAHARTMGPGTCAEFDSLRPGVCDNCQYQAVPKMSPIRLGEASNAHQPAVANKLDKYSINHESAMHRFRTNEYGPDKLPVIEFQVREKTEDGNWVWPQRWHKLMSGAYKVEHIERDYTKGHHILQYRFLEPQGAEFIGRATGEEVSGAKLFDFLSSKGVFTVATDTVKRKAHQALNHLWLEDLREQAPSMQNYEQFGWHRDEDEELTGFVGAHVYTVNGEIRETSLAGNALSLGKKVAVSGTLERWKEIMDVFMQPGQEMQQFCLMLGLFGPFSAAADFGEGFAAVALVSLKGGQGKTTAARLATSAWMHPNTQSSQNDTALHRTESMAVVRNLPYLVDEMTMADGTDVTNMLYTAANQHTRGRMTQSAQMRDPKHMRLPLFITSNASIRDMVNAAMQSMDQAANTRLIQITTEKDPALEQKLLSTGILDDLNKNYGSAGDYWMRTMLGSEDGRNKLDDYLRELEIEVRNIRNASNSPAGFRFFAMTAATAIVGARWCERFGFLPVSAKRINDWVYSTLMEKQDEAVAEAEVGRFQLLTEFLQENIQEVVSATIVRPMIRDTNSLVSRRDKNRVLKPPTVFPEPASFRARTVRARWETFCDQFPNSPAVKENETRLLVSRTALKEFLQKRNCDMTGFVEEARQAGVLVDYKGPDNCGKPVARGRARLTAGYAKTSTPVYVLVFDPSKDESLAASKTDMVPDNVAEVVGVSDLDAVHAIETGKNKPI